MGTFFSSSFCKFFLATISFFLELTSSDSMNDGHYIPIVDAAMHSKYSVLCICHCWVWRGLHYIYFPKKRTVLFLKDSGCIVCSPSWEQYCVVWSEKVLPICLVLWSLGRARIETGKQYLEFFFFFIFCAFVFSWDTSFALHDDKISTDCAFVHKDSVDKSGMRWGDPFQLLIYEFWPWAGLRRDLMMFKCKQFPSWL